MYDELLTVAVSAARQAAPVLRGWFRSAGLEVRAKAENDFVTAADHESEAILVTKIRESFPDHRILAEEGGGSDLGGSEFQWIIDPLDGTTNFLQGLPTYAISIGCRRGDELVLGVVYDPEHEGLFSAVRGGGATWNGQPMRVSRRPGLKGGFLATGYPFKAKAALDLYLRLFRDVFFEARAIRRCGSAALDLAYTAAGVYDGFFEFRLSPWDLAAGALLIEEAGGAMSDLDGGSGYLANGNFLAGAPGVHRELLEVVGRHASEAVLAALDPPASRSAGHSAELAEPAR